MGLDARILRKLVVPQSTWRREDAFDAMFALRVVVAIIAGLGFGAVGCQGVWYFVGFIIANYAGANIWLQWQEINIDEMEAVNGSNEVTAPSLVTEGLAQSVPLFVVSIFILPSHFDKTMIFFTNSILFSSVFFSVQLVWVSTFTIFQSQA